jgi:DNA-binding transcriptional ArsR family regulator
MKNTPKTQKVASLLQTAGDSHRLEILCALFRGSNACVSEIASSINMSVASTSHHLRSLADAGIVQPVRRGKHICYKLSDSAIVTDLKNFICKYK